MSAATLRQPEADLLSSPVQGRTALVASRLAWVYFRGARATAGHMSVLGTLPRLPSQCHSVRRSQRAARPWSRQRLATNCSNGRRPGELHRECPFRGHSEAIQRPLQLRFGLCTSIARLATSPLSERLHSHCPRLGSLDREQCKVGRLALRSRSCSIARPILARACTKLDQATGSPKSTLRALSLRMPQQQMRRAGDSDRHYRTMRPL